SRRASARAPLTATSTVEESADDGGRLPSASDRSKGGATPWVEVGSLESRRGGVAPPLLLTQRHDETLSGIAFKQDERGPTRGPPSRDESSTPLSAPAPLLETRRAITRSAFHRDRIRQQVRRPSYSVCATTEARGATTIDLAVP